MNDDRETCDFCNGRGTGLDGYSECPSCEGRGWHEAMYGPFLSEDEADAHWNGLDLEGYDGDAL